MASAHALGAYAPTLVIGFGYDRLQSNAMMTIGAWILLVLNLLWGWLADKYSKRGLMVFLGVLGLWVFQLGNRLLITSSNRDLRFGFLTMATAFMANWRMLPPPISFPVDITDRYDSDAVNGAWLSLNARSAGERSITMAIFVMGANIAGIAGSQIFQAHDAPVYRTGWTIIVALCSASLFMSIVANAQYWLLNKFQKREGEDRYKY